VALGAMTSAWDMVQVKRCTLPHILLPSHLKINKQIFLQKLVPCHAPSLQQRINWLVGLSINKAGLHQKVTIVVSLHYYYVAHRCHCCEPNIIIEKWHNKTLRVR